MKEILITSSILILTVILLRLLFRNKVSRRLIYGAWLLVALRLLIPFQFGNLSFSILAQAEPVTNAITEITQKPVSGPDREQIYSSALQEVLSQDRPVFIPEVQEQVDSEVLQSGRPAQEVYEQLLASNKPENILLPEINREIETVVSNTVSPTIGQIATVVWIVGMAVMAGWFAYVNVSLSRKLRRSATVLEQTECRTPIKVSSELASPCLFGLLRPTVYLTPGCISDEQIRRYVLTHELTHMHTGDHIWTWVRCLCLCIYWFNPLVWVAAKLSKRDCELACDEAVLKQLGESERIAYGKTLVDMVSSLSAPGQLLETATAMYETKKQLKERVKCIVKKPKVFLTAVIVLVLVLTVITGCAFVGAVNSGLDNPIDETQPTTDPTTTPTTVPSTTAPSVPETTVAEDPELAYFDQLFAIWWGNPANVYDYKIYYNSAVGRNLYESPTELNLLEFFWRGFSGETTPTDAEITELKQYVNPTWVDNADFYRLPKEKMDAELQKIFGVSLLDLSAVAFEGLTYLESTDCYYFFATGVMGGTAEFAAKSVEHLEDGTVKVTYECEYGRNVVTLKPNGDGYRILSNIQIS